MQYVTRCRYLSDTKVYFGTMLLGIGLGFPKPNIYASWWMVILPLLFNLYKLHLCKKKTWTFRASGRDSASDFRGDQLCVSSLPGRLMGRQDGISSVVCRTLVALFLGICKIWQIRQICGIELLLFYSIISLLKEE